tara:strand:+ start:1130 stop:1357 length:228 start_codon:yes stop_codon:yes gene_type:complete
MKRDIKEMIGMAISFAIIIVMALLLVGCSIPKNPKVSFGKKCVDKQDSVVYSYVWLYNKEDGLQANKEICKQIED